LPTYGLLGRPDRIVEGGIPEGWKSASQVWPWHQAQLAVYFLLIEEETSVRPPHKFIETGSGERVMVGNTPEVRAWVVELAGQIRSTREQIKEPTLVSPTTGQYRACGLREGWGQRSDR